MTHILEEPTELRTGPDGRPAAFRWRRRWRRVAEVVEEWMYQEPWWEGGRQPGQAPERAFYRVRTADGSIFELAIEAGTGRASVYRAFD